ncbi:MAG: acyl-CoA thioesterase [Flavobacteriales bacterium]|nr:acyl-CoA thioesterase [Flavobacteriales bacterium]
MSRHAKKANDSLAIATHLVLPENTNTLGNLMGGQLMNWMDIASAISAHRHCRRIVVTAAVNNVSFQHPIKLGDVVTIEAKVSRAFNSSMEVYMEVFVEHATTGERTRCNEAIYTFVAVDQLGSPINVPDLVPESEEEKRRYDGALRRRQLRLILAGKMKPEEATELKALFVEPKAFQ